MISSARRRRVWYGLMLALWAASPAAAAVRVDIVGAPEALQDNIRAHIGNLPEDADEAGRGLQRRIREAADKAAQALGYYNSRFRLDRERRGDDVVFRLDVEPGARARITEIDVEIVGEAQDDDAFRRARQRLPIAVGQPLNHAQYENAKQILQNLALRRGYFDAGFTRQRVVVDAAANTARVELRFDSGVRYRIGQVRFSETPFRRELLDQLVPFERGTPYSAEEIVELNRALLASRYFETVQVRPLPDEAADYHVPVEVNLTPVEPNRVGLGLGYSTDVGPRARINWRRRWLNTRGHSAAAQLEVSDVRQTLETQYQIPWSHPLDDVVEFQLGLQNEDFQDTESERFTLSVQRQQTLDSGWRRALSIRWDYTDFVVADVHDITRLVLPGLSFTRTRTRGGVDPVWGDRLLLATEATHALLGSDIALQRLRMGGRWLRSIAREHRFLLRADAGALSASDFDRVPPSLRFFAGGDQSVRGFAYNSIAPTNAAGDLIGGRYLLTGSAEYGWYVRDNWRLALFADAGSAMNSVGKGDDDIKVGTGFGVHWISPVGPIRVDLAWGVSEDDVPFRLHFSMGPQL